MAQAMSVLCNIEQGGKMQTRIVEIGKELNYVGAKVNGRHAFVSAQMKMPGVSTHPKGVLVIAQFVDSASDEWTKAPKADEDLQRMLDDVDWSKASAQ